MSEEDDSSELDQDDADEMADFIDDGELHEESKDADGNADRHTKSRSKKHKKRKKPISYRLDDEDREIIKENTGIEIKPKNRLKRNADRQGEDPEPDDDKALVKKEIEV